MSNNCRVTGNLTVVGTSNVHSQIKCAILKDEKASGTGAGTSSAAATQDRTLNTAYDPYNLITIVAGNVLFTFDETGTYLIKVVSTAFRTSRAKLFLTNSSNTILLLGTSEYIFNVNPPCCQVLCSLDGLLTVTSTATQYKIRMYSQSGVATVGLGTAVIDGNNEVYTELVAIKISD